MVTALIRLPGMRSENGRSLQQVGAGDHLSMLNLRSSRRRLPLIYNVAQLSADQLRALQSFETETGRTVIALSGIEAEPATLSDDEVARIQTLEKELGLTLVAVG